MSRVRHESNLAAILPTFRLGLAFLLPAACLGAAAGAPSPNAIVNNQPRRDVRGEIINAHDGCLEQFNGRFFLYGTAYGAAPLYKPGRRLDPAAHRTSDGPAEPFVCYSSSNLVDWVSHGPILPSQPDGLCVRPYVKYNARTRKYVLWFNWAETGQGVDGKLANATADAPEGPFTLNRTDVRVAQSPLPLGDLGLFVDDDETGYIIYVRIDPQAERTSRHRIAIDRLAPDYLGSTLESSGILVDDTSEAPSLFKRAGLYYALFDRLCSYCPQGTGAKVFTATSPLGPYTFRNNINRDGSGAPIIAAQQTHVAAVNLGGGVKYLWMGDRWRSAPHFGHNYQYWSGPLTFAEDGTIRPLQWEDHWPLDRLTEPADHTAPSRKAATTNP